ncbi:MAG: hypothetical protein EAZ89_11190 [Bacteroidetes bacterium]|nr:MAG: hypothetical protein EAZ89_11190 [Bacteroidota bacterium]
MLLFPFLIHAQVRTHLGVNLTSLPLQTLDLRADFELAKNFALQIGSGFRYQQHSVDQPPRLSVLNNYIQLKNTSAFLSVGGRIFNRIGLYDYPYMSFDVTGVYFDESIKTYDDVSNSIIPMEVSGFRLGASATLGFVIRITPRLFTDLGLQFGYAKPREELVSYFFPGMGYSTYGYGILGVRGGHINPVVSLKYNIVQDRRQRLHQRD